MDPSSPPSVPTEAQDAACVRRLAQDDPRALRELYERHGRRVQALALHLLRDAGEAEDLVQETFVEVWRRRAEFDPARAAVGAWILMMARSRSLTRLRARTSARARDEASASDVDEPQPPAALRLVEAREDRERVSGALSCLPAEQRRAIELAYYEGLSQSEISERTKEPLGTVKTRIRLGMQKLAALLVSPGGDL